MASEREGDGEGLVSPTRNQPVSNPTFPLEGQNPVAIERNPNHPHTTTPDPSHDSPNHGGTVTVFVYFVNFKLKPEDDDLPEKMSLLESKLLFINGHLPSEARYDGKNKICSITPVEEGSFMVSIGENETERLKGSYEATIKFAYEVETSMLSWNSTKSQGLPLSLRPCTLAFPRFLPVVKFLMMNITGFGSLDDVKKFRVEVKDALIGLKVRVNHRTTNKEYTIAGLTDEDAAHEITFDRGGEKVDLVSYFLNHWNKVVEHINTPCLELGTIHEPNKVPIEFCELLKGRYRREEGGTDIWKWEWGRRRATHQIVQAELGPYKQGNIEWHFGNKVDAKMTKVTGWVLGAPPLVLHDHIPISVNLKDGHWSLHKKTLMNAESLEHWALIDFSSNELLLDEFVGELKTSCGKLGLKILEPLVKRQIGMDQACSLEVVEAIIKGVMKDFRLRSDMRLQMIVCVMTKMSDGYRLLKWLCETKFGVLTQCCLLPCAKKGDFHFFSKLCLKMNAKLGGSNFEVSGNLVELGPPEEPVMFIGAAHPHHNDIPSVSAVVASVNWPAANRYAARLVPQAKRSERIIGFGGMCSELVKLFAGRNKKCKPSRIVVFRTGASDAVVKEELADLKKSMDYQPRITAVVVQKRHDTRVIVDDGKVDVPCGTVFETVVDGEIDFYLCSHYAGRKGKPTEYRVVLDENEFTGEKLQLMVYDMCFTFASCTNPVSVVPPVLYAEQVSRRGRFYREVLKEIGAHVSDPALYQVHQIKNLMFFL